MSIIGAPVALHKIFSNPNQAIEKSLDQSKCRDIIEFVSMAREHGLVEACRHCWFIGDIEQDVVNFQQALLTADAAANDGFIKEIQFKLNGETFRLIESFSDEKGFNLSKEPTESIIPKAYYLERVTGKEWHLTDRLWTYDGNVVADLVNQAKLQAQAFEQ